MSSSFLFETEDIYDLVKIFSHFFSFWLIRVMGRAQSALRTIRR